MQSEHPQPGQLNAMETLMQQASVVHPAFGDLERWQQLAAQIHDWDVFVSRAAGAHLTPLLARNLKTVSSNIIPAQVIALITSSYHSVLARNIILYTDFQQIATMWHRNGIPVIPLKGIYLAEQVYQDIGLRHLSDIDLLLRPQDMEASLVLASAQGWTVHKEEHQSEHFKEHFGTHHPFKLVKGATLVELHVHIHRASSAYRVRIEDFWQRASTGVLSDCTVQMPDALDTLLHLCLHLHKHLYGSEVKIVSFCDIREFIRANDPLDWPQLMARAKDYAAEEQVAAIMLVCHRFWGCAVPDAVTDLLSDKDRVEVVDKFLMFFRNGNLDTGSKQHLAFKTRITALAHTGGTKNLLRYLRGYFLPGRSYLHHRYGKHRLVLNLYMIHLLSFGVKSIRVLRVEIGRRFKRTI